jgi:hypothetical protein
MIVNNADDLISQKEKRQVLANDRKVRATATYHSAAQACIDDERGGRYATGGSKASVVGASPISYPTQPENSPWRRDACPPEPPLGYAIDEQEPVGEVFERATPAVDEPPATGVSGGSKSVGTTDPRAATRPFPRRA